MPRTSKKFSYNKTQTQPTVKQDDISIYKTAVYIRLSVEDIRKKESDSIGNQKAILLNHIQKQPDLQLYDIYEDVDYTGSNFNRPAFSRMMEDINVGLVDCVIVKDLSRLGRNNAKTSEYIEDYFPNLGVRFIAVNDNVDTAKGENDMVAFHNVFNELYPKQVSRKVRQVKKTSARQGKFMGSQAPYGYIKSPKDKHILIIDERVEKTVLRLFTEFAAGDSGRLIADRLNKESVSSPRFYHYEQLGRENPYPDNKTFGEVLLC